VHKKCTHHSGQGARPGNHQETVRTHREIAYVLERFGRHKEAKHEDSLAGEKKLVY